MDKFSKLEDINKFLVCGTFCKERRATSDPGYILTNLKLEPITVAKNNKKQFALN